MAVRLNQLQREELGLIEQVSAEGRGAWLAGQLGTRAPAWMPWEASCSRQG